MEVLKKLMLANGIIDSNLFNRLNKSLPEDALIAVLKQSLFNNNLIQLAPDIYNRLFLKGESKTVNVAEVVDGLIFAQETAKHLCKRTTNIYVAAMPKSGSSFLSHSLAKSMSLPFSTLTTSSPLSSEVGLNGREQEIDELALLKRALQNHGFVAQHHTKSTPYLINLFNNFNVKIIVGTRNIFDGIMSFDDMLLTKDWIASKNQWSSKIPLNYRELSFEERTDILSTNYGVWCIDFYLSWKRMQTHAGAKFLLIDYDTHISKTKGNKDLLCSELSKYLQVNDHQKQKFFDVISGSNNISKRSARMNQGKSGRGVLNLSVTAKKNLTNYASKFKCELDEIDMIRLFGDAI